MFLWTKWRNPIAVIAVTGMLTVTAIAALMTAGDMNEASDAHVTIGALSDAASNVELAWFQMMGADALAATGQAPAESQGAYDGAINLYNANKAVLASAGISQIDQALAGSDQGIVAMNATFAGTMELAESGDIAGATSNHIDGTLVLYGGVEPAVLGLGQVAAAASDRLTSKMDSGATQLRVLFGFGIAVAAMGAAFAGWTVWSSYRKEEDDAASIESPQSASYERAA